ncbi:hypothetical protein PBRA_005772 [Plasmodiophora brassicae]|uniref:Glycosyltransferase 61 catalytic domain-containing protein n=1 Tax=Plasmodiophora brassicae TaxID=37360 RepID=A0A0G4IPF4_PLABS|nr:hypothetical protein PBRA_005772 [Plasmodiophora brassicae]
MFGKGAGDHVFLQGTVVALLQFWAAGNYYHTMMEAVVRLAIVHTYLIDNAAARVLVETNMPQVWHFVLDLLGVDRGRLIEYQSDKLHAVEHLLVPTVPDCFVAHGAAQRAMRTLLREGYRRLYPNAGRGPGVVVHARTDGARIVANHEELVAALKSEFGAEDIAEFRPGAAMPDAAGLHYAARVVVAPHGAGLANMLFMDAGTAIVELHPPHGNGWTNHGPHAVNECFAISAHRLGIRYRAIIGGGSGDTSFSVDAARVAEAVKEFLVS